MHELSIMQSALELACERAAAAGATRIHALTLRVGVLSGVVPEALEFAFEVAREGTLAEGATLTIERVPVSAVCEPCRAPFASDDVIPHCPRCGAFASRVESGHELELDRLEVS
jgi:hydrogenase nickel incorporation protein HypA/HybF